MRYPCGYRSAPYPYNLFISDPLQKRMNKVLAYYWEKEGQGGRRFERWRIKYLYYIKTKYPIIYAAANG
jgi:hypothetical protein